MKLNQENINDLLSAVNDIGRDGRLEITKEHIDDESFYIYIDEAHEGYDEDSDECDMSYYESLIGLKMEVNPVKNQYHKSDGTEVTYKVKMELPNGNEVRFDTEMCYMVGWNYCGDDIEF